MTPPISIGGTDITGATIDGTDVTEITVDGQTVFSAGPSNLPVAYSNLVAWYPFDSATYGGSNADDVTAILGGSGDDTAYDGTVNGPTYQSSGGVTDINAGANSGAFFSESTNDITVNDNSGLNPTNFTLNAWVNPSQNSQDFANIINRHGPRIYADGNHGFGLRFSSSIDGQSFSIATSSGHDFVDVNENLSTGVYTMMTGVYDGSSVEIYINGNFIDSNPAGAINYSTGDLHLTGSDGDDFFGTADDIRIYNKPLNATEINQIYQNTKP